MRHVGFYKICPFDYGPLLIIYKLENKYYYLKGDAEHRVVDIVLLDNYMQDQLIVSGQSLSNSPIFGDQMQYAYLYDKNSICVGQYDRFSNQLLSLINQDKFKKIPFVGIEVAKFLNNGPKYKIFAEHCYKILNKIDVRTAKSWINSLEIDLDFDDFSSGGYNIVEMKLNLNLYGPVYIFDILDYYLKNSIFRTRSSLIRYIFETGSADDWSFFNKDNIEYLQTAFSVIEDKYGDFKRAIGEKNIFVDKYDVLMWRVYVPRRSVVKSCLSNIMQLELHGIYNEFIEMINWPDSSFLNETSRYSMIKSGSFINLVLCCCFMVSKDKSVFDTFVIKELLLFDRVELSSK
jgi:hypothetical protein